MPDHLSIFRDHADAQYRVVGRAVAAEEGREQDQQRD